MKQGHIDIGEYPDSTGRVTYYRTPDSRSLVTLHTDVDDNPGLLVETICHESSHVVDAIFASMAESSPGEEIRAYMIGIVAREIFHSYIRTRGDKLRELRDGRDKDDTRRKDAGSAK